MVPVIDFLADYLGLGGIPNAIKNVILGLQGKVEKILDRVIGFVVEKAKALWQALKNKGKGKDDKKEGNKPGDPDKADLEAKLNQAVEAVEVLMEDNPTLDNATGQIEEIRARFGLKRLEAKQTSPVEVSIEAEINPKKSAKEKFKKSQIAKIRDDHKRQEACEQAGYHGEMIETRGGSPQRAEDRPRSISGTTIEHWTS